AVDAAGRMLALRDGLVRGLRGRVRARRAGIDAEQAILAAARHLDIAPEGAPTRRSGLPGPARAAVHAAAGISRDDIPVKLVYVVDDFGSLQLCWNVVIRTPDGRHWWNLYVDAVRGEVLRRNDWIAHDTYRVHPLPQASPDEGPRALLVDAANTLASPFGWHDTNGVAGAEFTDTRGNNAWAQDDIDANDVGGVRPDGGAGLDFDPPLDLDTQPGNHLEASVAQLFYFNNVIHDVMYHYGFDEAAGNFQQNNYGNGGLQGDPVRADSQDGSGVDNAQFGTPPDGLDPRMEMFRWVQLPSPHLAITTPGPIAGTYAASPGRFGGGTAGLAGTLVQALDPSDIAGPSTTDACSPLTNAAAVVGKIALIDRGICTFVTKVGNAQAAGAIGVVIANNAGNGLVDMAGVDSSLEIPAIFIGQSDGASIAAQLGVGVTGDIVSVADRDSSLDAAIVVHEYAHGITNRLTGGPSNVNCMDAPESGGMGEGFSDWFALVMTALPSDQATDARGVSPYLLGQPPSGGGIRNEPYSTDLGVSPFTYADISGLNQPHGVGEVWASALWETYWNFVDLYGFDADLYVGTGGNNRVLQIVMDALKLQECDPTFVEGRDALLTADLNANGGVNGCLIWKAFAKRGVGLGASDAGGPDSLAVTEAFDVPPICLPEPGSSAMLLAGSALLAWLDRRRRTLDRRPR
ncbi:MAG: M36 family metallopeptidase, partial [Deltaproteobacteria bacterium]|nr:M36 family metallopeptidase [Deltaproteobacteria bacterium]